MLDIKMPDFDKLQRLVSKLENADQKVIKRNLVEATHDFGQRVYDKLHSDLESGRPDWKPLSDATVILRGERNAARGVPASKEYTEPKGSTRPLVDSGAFKRAIELEQDQDSSRVGILIPTGEDGQNLEMISQIMENGAAIRVTERMRRYLSAQGINLRRTTTVIIVPPRPLFGPNIDDVEEHLNEWMQPYDEQILNELGFREFFNA